VTYLLPKLKSRIKRFLSEFYRVPYCVPAWDWAEHKAILKCIFTGTIIDGPQKEKLYELIRNKTGMKYVFGFNSGQQAILAALKAERIGTGDKVVMPSYCCETVAMAVVDSGASPLFCDIGDDLNPDIENILKLIDLSVKSIIFPHLFGNPGAIDKLELALEKKGIRSQILLIDDAAQSFGARLNGRLIGTFGDAGIISFGPGKTMTASGGGILITSSSDLAQNIQEIPTCHIDFKYKLKRLIYWIIFRRWRRFTLPFYPFFSPVFKTKPKKQDSIYALCNVDAAIAVLQLKKLNDLIEIRVKRKEILDTLFTDFSDSFYLLPKNNSNSNFLNVATKYAVYLKPELVNQDSFNIYRNIMNDSGVEIQDLYVPIHMKAGYNNFRVSLLKTESQFNKIYQFPVEPSISDQDFNYILSRFMFFCKSLASTKLLYSDRSSKHVT